ncbi:MAG: hypothetical protein ACPLW7_02910 [Minisyncoccia bacterium]
MARKFLVVLLIAILIGIAQISQIPVATAETNLKQPDITTEKIIILDPAITPFLKQGTLSIVSFVKGNIIGFQVGKAYSTNLIVVLDKIIDVSITQPVALLLKGKILEIYISNINIVTLDWLYLSIPEVPKSYFPLLLSAQIVKIIKTGSYDKEVNYCCNPPLQKTSYFYKLYLTTKIDPYVPPKESNIELGIMIPDYLVDTFLKLAANGDYIWIGVNGDNQIYLWLSY